MTTREYECDQAKKEVRLHASGYKGIKNELSSATWLEKMIVGDILWDIYNETNMWESSGCNINVSTKCQDSDEYDEKTGKEICNIKADLKYHNMMYNRYVYVDYVLGKLKIAIAKLEKKHMEKMERLEKDLDQYMK